MVRNFLVLKDKQELYSVQRTEYATGFAAAYTIECTFVWR